jgi:pyridoxine 5-phosphate synthase
VHFRAPLQCRISKGAATEATLKTLFKSFIDLVDEVQPAQVTLVPDAPDALTSNAGWDTIKHQEYLKEMVAHFKNQGIRTSILWIVVIEGAGKTGVDRIETLHRDYARLYATDKQKPLLLIY